MNELGNAYLKAVEFAVRQRALAVLDEGTRLKLREIQEQLNRDGLSNEEATLLCKAAKRVYRWKRRVILAAKMEA